LSAGASSFRQTLGFEIEQRPAAGKVNRNGDLVVGDKPFTVDLAQAGPSANPGTELIPIG
jgi:hypothetical protein